MSQIVNALKRKHTLTVNLKLTSASGGISEPVLLKNQFKTLGIITTDSQGFGSGRYQVVNATQNLTAQFSGTATLTGSSANISV